jgi:hypothetical protein
MSTYYDTVKEAYEQGIILDWSGNTPKYYDWGAFINLSGLDPNSSGSTPTPPTPTPSESGVTYTGIVDALTHPTIDTISEEDFAEIPGMTINDGQPYEIKFILPPHSVAGLNNMTQEEFESERDKYAQNLLFAMPSRFKNIEIIDVLGIDVTQQFSIGTLTMHNEEYNIYMRVDYEAQVNMFDPETGETGENIILDYTIKFVE